MTVEREPMDRFQEHLSRDVLDRVDERNIEHHPRFDQRVLDDRTEDPLGSREPDPSLQPEDARGVGSAAMDPIGSHDFASRRRDLHHMQTHVGREPFDATTA